MSAKDRVDIKYGMAKDVDYVAASFVQSAAGVREIRAYLEECARDLAAEGARDPERPLPLVVSKIESQAALAHFDEILAESDGIMVARGDLGVEIPIQQVTNAQKQMVAACNAAGKPVIVATQVCTCAQRSARGPSALDPRVEVWVAETSRHVSDAFQRRVAGAAHSTTVCADQQLWALNKSRSADVSPELLATLCVAQRLKLRLRDEK